MIKVEFFTHKAKLPASDAEQTVDVLIRVTPPENVAQAKARPALNLSLVIDRSGSMEGLKMRRANEAAAYCVDQMTATDRLSVVIFDDVIETLIASQKVENKAVLKSLINGIHARNSTALHEAWVRGGIQVSDYLDHNAVNRVLLITDGQANVGETRNDVIVTQTKQVFERGVSTSTIGIGADFNEDLLLPMAQGGGGNAWHVAEPEDMQKIFDVELQGLIAQIGHTVTLGLVPADGVRIVDVLNDFEISETGRYKLPNLQAGSPLEIIVQLKVPAQKIGSRLDLLDLKLGFTPQESTQATVLRENFNVEFVEASESDRLETNYEVAKALQLLMNARARKEAMQHLDAGDYAASQQVLASARRATNAVHDSMPAFIRPAFAEENASLVELESSLDSRGEDKMSRKKMMYQSYQRGRGK